MDNKVFPFGQQFIDKSLWQQFIDKKDQFIGCILEDHDPGFPIAETVVTDIKMEKWGESTDIFTIEGKAFKCSFNVKYGGIGDGDEGWLTFYRYGGAFHRIKTAV